MEHLFKDNVPDWSLIDFDVLCARCGYNLRTLTKPKCPECGFDFEWHQAVNAYSATNQRLFEHVWRKQPIFAFLRAAFVPLFRPKAFWTCVSLHDRIRIRPLIALLGLSFIAFIAIWQALANVIWLGADFLITNGYVPVSGTRSGLYTLQRTAADLGINALLISEYQLFLGAVFLFLLLLASTAMLLDETLTRLRLRPAHMLRVTAYAALPAMVAVSVCSLGAILITQLFPRQLRIDNPEYFLVGSLAIFIAPLVFQLHAGLRYYLHIPHAVVPAVVLPILAALGAIVLMMIGGALVMAIF